MRVTDPVCGMQIDSAKAAAREEYQRQTYYFCSASCREKFKATPERYVSATGESGSKSRCCC